jgi:hypothetical protein
MKLSAILLLLLLGIIVWSTVRMSRRREEARRERDRAGESTGGPGQERRGDRGDGVETTFVSGGTREKRGDPDQRGDSHDGDGGGNGGGD